LLVQAKGKKVLQRIEAAVDGRPGAALLMLPFHKVVDLAKGDLRQGHGGLGKEQAQIQGRTRHGMRRELPALEGRPKPIEGGLADIVHRLPPLEPLLLFDWGHSVVVLGAFGPVIQLRRAEGHMERAVPHQFFDHFQ
jgi:hypothetical protein